VLHRRIVKQTTFLIKLIATELLTVRTHFQMMHLSQQTEDRLTSAGDTKPQLIKQQIISPDG